MVKLMSLFTKTNGTPVTSDRYSGSEKTLRARLPVLVFPPLEVTWPGRIPYLASSLSLILSSSSFVGPNSRGDHREISEDVRRDYRLELSNNSDQLK